MRVVQSAIKDIPGVESVNQPKLTWSCKLIVSIAVSQDVEAMIGAIEDITNVESVKQV